MSTLLKTAAFALIWTDKKIIWTLDPFQSQLHHISGNNGLISN
jgi:hypothetical protein